MPELREAHAHCLRASRRHYENFPVVALLGGDERRSVAAIYAFARTADDFADEPEHAGRREALIDAWEAALRAAVEGRPEGPVMTALAHAIQRHDLPIDPFLDLLDAFRQDVRQDRHDTWESLLEYSRRSANPIGRLVLRVHGVSGEVPARHADALCTALQLANFWQDVGVDASRGRIYLPRADREAFGVREEDLLARRPTPALGALLGELVFRTRRLFEAGAPLCDLAPRRLGLWLRLVSLGGRAVLDRVEASRERVLVARPVLDRADWVRLGARALLAQVPAWASGARRLVEQVRARR
jgi:squalene synthase HpnC